MANFNDWYAASDMPAKDAWGNWFDMETGLYFDKKCERPIIIRLRQYFGKRVVITQLAKNKNMFALHIENSALKSIADIIITRAQFDTMPSRSNEQQVEWACQLAGINL